MRKPAIATLIFAATLTGTAAFAQQKMDDMKGMDMKSMDMKSMDMKGMDMKGVGMKDMQGMKMKGMDADKPAASNAKTYQAVGVVKALNAAAGTVTFDHEAVKSLNWPAMTMSFNIKDKALFDRLAQGKKVKFEFVSNWGSRAATQTADPFRKIRPVADDQRQGKQSLEPQFPVDVRDRVTTPHRAPFYSPLANGE